MEFRIKVYLIILVPLVLGISCMVSVCLGMIIKMLPEWFFSSNFNTFSRVLQRLSANSEIQEQTYKLYVKIFSEGLRLQLQTNIQKVFCFFYINNH